MRNQVQEKKSKGHKERGHPLRRSTDVQPQAKPGVGAFVAGLLLKGKGTDEVLKAVDSRFPESETTRASVSWYKSKLRKEGKLD